MESIPPSLWLKIAQFCDGNDHQELAKSSKLFQRAVEKSPMSKKRKRTNDEHLLWCAGEIVWASFGRCFWPAMILDTPKQNGTNLILSRLLI